MASRPLSRVRRGRGLLGAGGDGADASADPRGRGPGAGAGETCGLPRGASARRGRAGLDRAAAGEPARSRGERRTPTGRISSPPGGCSSRGSPTPPRWCWCSRICSGPTRRCSPSSSTCSSGRVRNGCSCSPSRGRSWPSTRRSSPGAMRNTTSLGLEPLVDDEMTALLDGHVPGLPAELKLQVLARAQGVPLYAVETVRMLLDRGLLAQDGAVYRPSGEIESLEVPESLHALAAARLDGLPTEERQLVQEACVLGKRFTKQALAALSGGARPRWSRCSRAWCARKCSRCRRIRARPSAASTASCRNCSARSPTRHSRAGTARPATSAAVARSSRASGRRAGGAEVIASHLLAAADAAPETAERAEIRCEARTALVQAGERAAALGRSGGGTALPRPGGRPGRRSRRSRPNCSSARAAGLQGGQHREARTADRAGDHAPRERATPTRPRAPASPWPTWTSPRAGSTGERRGSKAALRHLEQAGPSPELAATLA